MNQDRTPGAPELAPPVRKARRDRPPPGRRARQSEGARQDILDAALRTIASVGFREASIDVIAEAAGISSTSIYWHFGNREGLLVALANRITDSYVDVVLARWQELGATTPEEKVRAYLSALVELATERPEILRAQTALSSEATVLPAVREVIRQHNREARRSTADAVDSGVAAGVFRPMAGSVWIDFVIGSFLGASIQASLHREGFDSRILYESVRDAALFLLGLPPGGAATTPMKVATTSAAPAIKRRKPDTARPSESDTRS